MYLPNDDRKYARCPSLNGTATPSAMVSTCQMTPQTPTNTTKSANDAAIMLHEQVLKSDSAFRESQNTFAMKPRAITTKQRDAHTDQLALIFNVRLS